MIEMIESKNIDESRLPKRELPKNVRQIGEAKENRKVYMEDFVVTYLGKLAKPNQAYARGAILFGNLYQTEEGPAVFISGAMEAQNLELDMDETIFNDEIWRELLRNGDKYFKGQRVMGWFLSRMGFSVEMNQKIINTHLKNFPGDHKILYMIDALEKEDAIYICENRQMIRQKGYYIYYEKNSAMQEYMLSRKPVKKEKFQKSEPKMENIRDSKVVERYRKKYLHSKKKPKRDNKIQLTRVASVFLIVVMCGYIYVEMAKRQWIDNTLVEQVEDVMGTVRNSLGSEKEVEQEVWKGEEGTPQKETRETSGSSATDASTDIAANTEFDTEKTEESTKETVSSFQESKPLYYIVKKGDTLASISRKMYLTDKYMKQIAWANDLDNANEIYEGQKIIIPAIE